MPTHRAHSGTGPADHAADEQQVHRFGDGRDRVGVLGQAHRPADHRASRRDEIGRRGPQLLLGQSRGFQDLVEIDCSDVLFVVVETRAVAFDERAVHDGTGRSVLGLEQQAAQALEQGHVAAEADLQELVGDVDTAPDHAVGLLRILEPAQAGLGQGGVDRDDPCAVALRLLERRQHPRMIRARILSCDDDQTGLFEVGNRHRALADADRVDEGATGRFVAHVRTVRHVVGAVAADEQLVEERGLVARAARGVEDGVVG